MGSPWDESVILDNFSPTECFVLERILIAKFPAWKKTLKSIDFLDSTIHGWGGPTPPPPPAPCWLWFTGLAVTPKKDGLITTQWTPSSIAQRLSGSVAPIWRASARCPTTSPFARRSPANRSRRTLAGPRMAIWISAPDCLPAVQGQCGQWGCCQRAFPSLLATKRNQWIVEPFFFFGRHHGEHVCEGACVCGSLGRWCSCWLWQVRIWVWDSRWWPMRMCVHRWSGACRSVSECDHVWQFSSHHPRAFFQKCFLMKRVSLKLSRATQGFPRPPPQDGFS